MELQAPRARGEVPPPPLAGAVADVQTIRPMAPWRIAGALALGSAFALTGWQIQRLVDGLGWTDGIMWLSALAAGLAAVCVLVWTWVATDNARRLIGPAVNRPLPDPHAAVMAWILPFTFVGLAIAVVAYLGAQVDLSVDETVAAIPLAVAVIALLLAIPLTYRPLHHLATTVRQVGGHSARLAQWMWVPVVLGIVGVASLVAIRLGIVDDSSESASVWGPLWAVAVVAIVPCVIVVLLAFRAGATVEEAMTVAASRRRIPGFGPAALPPPVVGQQAVGRQVPLPLGDTRSMIRLVPGANVLRLSIVTLLAGLALLSVVGAAVMFMFWLESNDGGLTPAQRDRAWDALDSLHGASRMVAVVLIALATVWTFVAVLNVRRASGRRRNPIIAALAWPAASVGVWVIADRLIIDQSIGSVVLGFAAQAAVVAVPFLLLERSAESIGARRTPIRIAYVFAVVLLVHTQGLGGLSTIQRTSDLDEFGRLAGYLALGALVLLMSTMAVTEACSSMSRAAEHEVEHHNMLAGQRVSRSSAPASPRPAAVQ